MIIFISSGDAAIFCDKIEAYLNRQSSDASKMLPGLLASREVRRMFLKPELPINAVDRAIEIAMDTFVRMAPRITAQRSHFLHDIDL